jgi:hypothetical protein
MKIITIIWIAAFLFALLALVASAITVVVGKGQWISGVGAISALLSMTAGFSGILLGMLHKRRPDLKVFTSKRILTAMIAIVFVLALFLTLVTGGL